MPELENQPVPAPVIVSKPSDKTGAIHHTPLRPGMTMKDLRPNDSATDEEREAAAALKKRIASVKIVKDLPARPKLRIVVATAVDGLSAKVLYCGFDAAQARAALVVADAHKHVDLFETPTKRVRANLSDVVHNTPFKAGAKRVEPTKAMPPQPPADFMEQEEAKRLAAVAAGNLSSSPQIVVDRVNRERELEQLSMADLNGLAAKYEIDIDGADLSEDELQGALCAAIVDRELPLPSSNNAAGGDSRQQDAGGSGSAAPPKPNGDKKPKGLGKS